MADKFLTLLEITKRSGTDAAVGLVEEVTTYAPEFDIIPGRAIKGISYKARVRTALHGKGAFRNANEGVEMGSSTYDAKQFDAYFFDAQMRVDEAVVRAAGLNDSMSEVMSDEASGVTRDKMIILGKQFYNGTANDAKGFPGLKDFANTALTVNATGTGASATYRAWFIRTGPQGIHFIWGNEQGLNLNEWMRIQVLDSASKAYSAWTNNLSGYIGLSCADVNSVGYVKNITSAAPLTDALGAEVVAKFPIGAKPNLVLVDRNTAFWLQRSRSATTITNRSTGATTGADVFAPQPDAIAGIPLVVTDSIIAETNF